MICLAIMTLNGAEGIKEVIDSWIPYVDQIHVFIDSKTSDNTRELVDSYHLFDFETFSKSRNKILDLLPVAEWTLMVDDSFILVGGELLRSQLASCNSFSMKIQRNGKIYERVIGFKSKYRIRFEGEIHEVLAVEPDRCLAGCYINDKPFATHTKRTASRLDYDIDILSKLQDPRSRYYLGLCVLKQWALGKCSETKVIDCFRARLNCADNFHEERFLTYVQLGHVYRKICQKKNALYSYLNASYEFPSRAGEAYYYMYLTTGVKIFIQKAYSCKLGDFRMTLDTRIYQSVIPKLMKKILLEELKDGLQKTGSRSDFIS